MQKPYDHNANHATKVLKLLHINICGPMPILTPKKQQHFFAILDDYTSYNKAEPIIDEPPDSVCSRDLHDCVPGYIQVPTGICMSTCIILMQFSLSRLHYACN